MAHKPQSFKLDEKNKVIIIYTNKDVPAEKPLITFYLEKGYAPKLEEKKATKTKAEMEKELKKDPEALKNFQEAYSKKNGFFDACKIYSNWKKNNK